MATQNAWTGPVSVPAAALKTATDAVRATGEKVFFGHHEIAECALKQATENVDALFGTLKTVSATTSPVDAASLYMRFLTDMSQKHLRHIAEIGALIARSSKDSWQPMADAIASAGKTPVPAPPTFETIRGED